MSTADMALFEQLAARRKELGMSIGVIAKRSGVSVPTVQRILAGSSQASVVNVAAVAGVLGLAIDVRATEPAKTIKERQARAKAQQVARYVTCGPMDDTPAIPQEIVHDLVERSTLEYLSGSPRRLWAEE